MHCIIIFPFFLKYLTNAEYMISTWPVALKSTMAMWYSHMCWDRLSITAKPLRINGLWAGIWTVDLSDMTQECHSLGHSIFYQLVMEETHSVLEIGTQNFILGNENCLKDPAFYIWVSVHHKSVIYNKPTRCNSGSIVFIKNYKYALHVLDDLCVHLQEHL